MMSPDPIDNVTTPSCFRESMAKRTAGFYELSAAEARRLGPDMLSHARLEANRGRMHEKATFRLYWDQKEVRKNPPGHRDHLRYAVYSAKALWEWQKNNARDPTGSFLISWEDWMALYHRYDNGGPIPEWVQRLRKIEWPVVSCSWLGETVTWVRSANALNLFTGEPFSAPRWEAYVNGALRFRQTHGVGNLLPKDGVYFQGAPGEEYAVFGREKNNVLFFKGAKGEEHVVYLHRTLGDGTVHKFTFSPTRESSQRPSTRGNPGLPNKCHLTKGRKLKEVMVKPTGVYTAHFAGPKGHERHTKTCKEVPDRGTLEIHYKGRKGHEAMYYKCNSLTREKAYYRGTRGKERAWKRFIGGYEFLFEGPKGHEALRSYYPASNPDGGERYWFDGAKGQEWSWRRRDRNGQVHDDDGSLGRPALLLAQFLT